MTIATSRFNYTVAGATLIALVFIIYSNTFQGPWILDDYQNIVNNPKIQISNLSLENIKGSLFSSQFAPENLYRPLSCLTFALNALANGKSVFGYHFVNISLHASTSLMLMWLLILVFKTPAFEEITDKEEHFIIILATVLWAVNPIQIQAVTYIVQRMTVLCALFSFMSLGFYLKARLTDSWSKKYSYFFCSAIGILCAILSKENGLITFPLILVLEYFLFRDGDYRVMAKKEFILAYLIFILLTACILFYVVSTLDILAPYAKRSFTVYERLLTQPKILLYYLSLIFYPLPQRLSLEHEIIISTNIFTPPLTFFYLVVVIFSFFACLFLKRLPLLFRIGIVFYLIAHSVESSIIPLEMVFEHRNYLPSAFLFTPVAFSIYRMYNHFRSRKKTCMVSVVIFFTIALIFMTSLATYSRNFDWFSSQSIWFDAMKKAPGHARPKQSMGFVIGMKNPEKALEYYSNALNGYMHRPKEEKASSLANAGLIFFHLKDYENAEHFFKLAIETENNHMIAHDFLIQTYMKKGAWEKAIEMADKNINLTAFVNLKAACLLQTGDFILSLDLCREIYRNNPENRNALLNIAESLSLSGYHKKANFFYKMYSSKYPEEPHVYLRMSKNYYLNGDYEKASGFLDIFFGKTGIEKTRDSLENLTIDTLTPLIGIKKMTSFIESKFEIYKEKYRIR